MSISNTDIRYFKLAVGSGNIGKEYGNDIVARCPVCGDSQKNKNTKRLHLYNKANETRIGCFNGDCSVGNRSVFSFLRNFYPYLFDTYKRETSNNTLSYLLNNESEDVFSSLKTIEDLKTIVEKPITTHNLFNYFSDIKNHDEALIYLGKRGYFYTEQYGKFYFGIQDLQIGDKLYKITNCIIIPLYYEDEMYGFYSRNIANKEFWTYMPEQNIGHKIWNFFNIDKNQEVYIFEGIFDAISSGLKNSIALMGAKIPQERLDELKKPVFVLDNDKTGLINSLSYAKSGYKVYVQPDKYKEKDMNELMLNNKELNVPEMIKENIYSGIMAQIKIQQKM